VTTKTVSRTRNITVGYKQTPYVYRQQIKHFKTVQHVETYLNFHVCFVSFKYHSEENILSLVCNETSPPVSGSGDPSLSPQFYSAGEHRIKAQHSWPSDHVTVEMLLRELERNRELQNELQDCVSDYQVNMTY
jgi:hypothetical protein